MSPKNNLAKFCLTSTKCYLLPCQRASKTGEERSIGTYEISLNANVEELQFWLLHTCGNLFKWHGNGNMTCVRAWLAKVEMCFISHTFLAPTQKSTLFPTPQKVRTRCELPVAIDPQPRAQFNMKWHILSIQIIIERIRHEKKKTRKKWSMSGSREKSKLENGNENRRVSQKLGSCFGTSIWTNGLSNFSAHQMATCLFIMRSWCGALIRFSRSLLLHAVT